MAQQQPFYRQQPRRSARRRVAGDFARLTPAQILRDSAGGDGHATPRVRTLADFHALREKSGGAAGTAAGVWCR